MSAARLQNALFGQISSLFFFFFFSFMCQAQLVKLVVRNLANGTSKTRAGLRPFVPV